MAKRNLILAALSMLLSITVSVAQDVCPDIVNEALTATDTVCSGIGRNEACYGNINIVATLADEDLVFEAQGDVVDLTEIERLTLSPYDEETEEWGVAVMNVQANIPDTVPGQGVMFLLFGGVDIENAGDAMEAFYFSSGVGTGACNESESGIIINTPEGVGTVSLIANDVTIELGSTALLTAQPDDLMTIALTEGNATVTAEGESQTFEGGFQVTVPVNEDLQAIGVPSEPEPIPEENMETLPDITEFIEDVDDEGDDDGDNGDDSSDTIDAGGDIVPLSGMWQFTLSEATASTGCPPGMADAMSSAPIPASYAEFGDVFNLQTLMESTAEGGLPLDTVYTNPEPNVYTMAFSQEGVTLSWTMILTSETTMTGAYSMDMSGMGIDCTLDVTYTVSLQE